MFKYTPPWQVLCHSLENNSKRQSNSPQDVQSLGKGRILSHSYQISASQDPVPAEDHQLSRTTMASIPKRWVMKPLTPKLEKSDFRTVLSPGSEPYSLEKGWSFSQNSDSHPFSFDNISVAQSSVRVTNGEGFGDAVHAKQVDVFEDSSTSEDWQPSTPNSPLSTGSTESHVGFYSFVDDPTSPEAEKNEVYMVSPQRQAKLSTLKEKSRFKLQTYAEDRKPEKLFQETNGDQYHIGDKSGKDNDEEETDRMEIIRNQAPKKNTVFKEQWSGLESLDLTNSPQRLVEGFSLRYSPMSTKPLQSEAEPGTIDNQQIDFNAARKQFEMMERTKQNSFRKSSQQEALSPKLQEGSLPAGAKILTKHVGKTETLKDDSWKRQEEEAMPIKQDLEDRIHTGLMDNVDWGLENQGVGSTSVGSLSTEPSMLDSISVASMSETPIEREIRIAQEREQDLRRSRGIFLPDTSEMVEIKTKPILSLPTPQIKPIKAKENNRMSFLIQREMERVNLNPGIYDRGSLHNQGERKRTFGSLSDQLDSVSSSTSPSINPIGRTIITENTSITENPVHVEQRDVFHTEEPLSPCCPHRHPDETVVWRESRIFGTRPYTKEWDEKENNKAKTANQPFWMADYKPKASRNKFRTTYPLSSPPEPERNSRSTGDWRTLSESSSEWPRMLNAPDIIRREIEENLRRERELQEQRETSNLIGASEEPTLPSFISSDEVSGQKSNNQTPINSSNDNLVEVEAVLPQKSTQRTSYSSSYSWNVDPTPVTFTSVPGPRSRLSSIMTAQPWSGPKQTTSAVHMTVPTLPSSPLTETSSHKGLTRTLLDDFEERRVRLKLEESAYAGIQPIDDINNEVVEVTRVIRHKNTRALRWEAGVYANEENN